MGDKKNILYNGLRTNPNITLSTSKDDCDYIMLNSRDCDINIEDKYFAKIIVVDYTDSTELCWKRDCYRYFKRSVVDTRNLTFCKYNRRVIPISYSIKNERLSCTDVDTLSRDIDISVFFNPTNIPYRTIAGKMATFVKHAKWPKGYTIHVGVLGNDGVTGRNTIQEPYYTMMLRSKIVITCNPDNWEGDYRLFEALSSGALVVSDSMITPVKHPFIDKEHLLYYDRNNFIRLKEIVEYYVAHDDERKKIARNGYTHARAYHTASDRIQEILEECVENPLAEPNKVDADRPKHTGN